MTDPSPGNQPVLRHPHCFYEIIRRHCRERLFQYPVRWTERHLRVLNISFVHEQEEYEPQAGVTVQLLPLPEVLPFELHEPVLPSGSRGDGNDGGGGGDDGDDPEPSDDKAAATRFFTGRTLPLRQQGLQRLVPNLHIREKPVQFYFGGEPVSNLPFTCLADSPHPSAAPIGYIDRCNIEHYREVAWDPDVLYKASFRSYDACHPYMAAMMIALAQEQHQLLAELDVRLAARPSQLVLATLPDDLRFLHVYVGDISPEFLDLFVALSRPAPEHRGPRPGMAIRHRVLSIRPLNTFKTRLARLISGERWFRSLDLGVHISPEATPVKRRVDSPKGLSPAHKKQKAQTDAESQPSAGDER